MDRLATLLQFLEEDPDDAFTRFAIAREYEGKGDYESALGYYEALTRDHPDYVGTYYHLGKLYETMGRTEDARATYRQGMQVAEGARDMHARAELNDALLKLEGLGWDDL